MTPFYKCHGEVLKMNPIKNKDEILFNHYLMQKENLQRLKGDLPKGQFYLSRNEISLNLEVNDSKAKRLIAKFIKIGIITQIKRGSNQQDLSIYRYNSIDEKSDQADDQPNDQASDQAKTSNINTSNDISDQASDQPNDQASDQYKKELLKRNIKKNIFIANSNEMNLSKLLFSLMQNNNPNFKQPNFQQWCKEFDYILRLDKRKIEEVKRVIKWCQNDSFWKSNILSPRKLREKYDQLYIKMTEENKKNLSSTYNLQDMERREKYYK